MHEMQTIVTDVRSVCLSVCQAAQLTRLHRAGVIRCSIYQITLASLFKCQRFSCKLALF